MLITSSAAAISAFGGKADIEPLDLVVVIYFRHLMWYITTPFTNQLSRRLTESCSAIGDIVLPFKKGQSGNLKGRPKGERNKTTLAVEALLDGEAEAITRKAIEKAKDGDMTAIRLCLDRLAPPVKDRPVSLHLPEIKMADDTSAASGAILQAVSNGEVTPGEAGDLMHLLDSFTNTLVATDLERRIAALESRGSGNSRN